MVRLARKEEMKQVLDVMLRADARATAGNNQWISRSEQRAARNPLIQQGAEQVRVDGGPGTWVDKNAAAQAAMDRVLGVMRQVNQPSGSGFPFISQGEIRAAKEIDAAVGEALWQAYEVVRGLGQPEDRPVAMMDITLPESWQPTAEVDVGFIHKENGKMVVTGLDENLSPSHKNIALRAFAQLWEPVFQWRADPAYPIKLGKVGRDIGGFLQIGTHTDPASGKEMVAARWRDIDDANFVFFLERLGGPEHNPVYAVRTSVFNN